MLPVWPLIHESSHVLGDDSELDPGPASLIGFGAAVPMTSGQVCSLGTVDRAYRQVRRLTDSPENAILQINN